MVAVTVGGQTKFVCVDGPEFDGHQVDFDEMLKRLAAFRTEEREELEHWNESHAHEDASRDAEWRLKHRRRQAIARRLRLSRKRL